MMAADPALIARWAEAWAISRGVAPPVECDGALYIHVGSEEQVGRYIFASLDRAAIRAVAAQIARPLVYLKVCAAADEAARGRIVAMRELVVFDRSRTAEAHRRRGLASAIMRALAVEAHGQGIADAMLCATPAGRGLYESLGWLLHSAYTTASRSPEICATVAA